MKKNDILGSGRADYLKLQKQLSGHPLLAQGNVFSIDPPSKNSRAAIRYIWTRKVNGKTVTKALSKEQYEAMKNAIEANRKVEDALRKMRDISQSAILESLPDSPGKMARSKRPKQGLS